MIILYPNKTIKIYDNIQKMIKFNNPLHSIIQNNTNKNTMVNKMQNWTNSASENA
jgi:hypothetical protein